MFTLESQAKLSSKFTFTKFPYFLCQQLHLSYLKHFPSFYFPKKFIVVEFILAGTYFGYYVKSIA